MKDPESETVVLPMVNNGFEKDSGRVRRANPAECRHHPLVRVKAAKLREVVGAHSFRVHARCAEAVDLGRFSRHGNLYSLQSENEIPYSTILR